MIPYSLFVIEGSNGSERENGVETEGMGKDR